MKLTSMMNLILCVCVLMLQGAFAYEVFDPADTVAKNAQLNSGTIKILSLVLYPAQFDSIELSKRFDIQITSIGLGDSCRKNVFENKTFYWPELNISREEMAADIEKALETSYDIIIIGSDPSWKAYPEKIRELLLQKVEDGTALLTFSKAKDLLTAIKNDESKTQPLEFKAHSFSAIDEKPAFTEEYYTYGKGIVAVLAYQIDSRQGYLTSISHNLLDYEYKLQRVANIMLHVAQQKAPLFKKVAIEDSKQCTISLSDKRPSTTLTYAIRDEEHRLLKTQSKELSSKTADYTFELPKLTNGTYAVECTLSENGKIIDWISEKYTSAYNPGFAAVTLKQDIVTSNDTLTLALTYTGKPAQAAVEMSFEDVYGRQYLKRRFDGQPEKLNIRIPDSSLSALNFIHLTLFDRNEELDSTVVEFSMPKNALESDYHVLLWNMFGNNIRARKYFAVAQANDVTGSGNCYVDSGTARSLAYFNLRGVPYSTWLHGILLDENMFDKEWDEKNRKRAATAATSYSRYGALGYTLGDENYVSAFKAAGRFSNSPQVTRLFQEYLAAIYQSIDALNNQWDTAYNDFNEIELTSEKELFKSYDNPSAWFDYRMFITRKFMAMHQDYKEAIQAVDTAAHVGWDGCEQFSSYDGYDWYQYHDGFTVNNVYARELTPNKYGNKMFNGMCVRSFSKLGGLRGCYMNNINSTWGVIYEPWYTALCQFNSMWWWTGAYLGNEVEAFDIDLQPAPIFKKFLKTAQEIQQGPATLLQHATFEFDPIAIHYSENNWHASTLASGIGAHINNLGLQQDQWFKSPLFGNDEELENLFGSPDAQGHYVASVKNFIMLLHDLGYQPYMVARQQIEAGELIKRGCKILVLPFVESLSEAEVQEIEKFVSQGGCVIADYHAGTRDGHGKVHETSPLDVLFGFERANFNLVKKYHRSIVDALTKPYICGRVESLFYNPAITLATAKALGCNEHGAPVFIKNKYGQGQTLYFNFDIYEYFTARKKGDEINYMTLIGNALKNLSGIEPQFEVLHENRPIRYTERFAYRDGDIRLYAIARDYMVQDHAPYTATLPLETTAHLYDVRKKQYLGLTDQATAILDCGEIKLLAHCPYKILDISLKMPEKVKRGDAIETDIDVLVSTDTAKSNHTVSISIYGSDHQHKKHLSKVLYLENGSGAYRIPIALNDTPGIWAIEVQEAISGTTSVQTFVVE